jgi:hypothetical protein
MNVPSIAPTSARYLAIVAEVRTRLCPICADMSIPLFDQMVERIALVQLVFVGDRCGWSMVGAY